MNIQPENDELVLWICIRLLPHYGNFRQPDMTPEFENLAIALKIEWRVTI